MRVGATRLRNDGATTPLSAFERYAWGYESGGYAVEDIPLADAIEVLRQQLTSAMLAGKDSPLRFEVGGLTLDLEVAVTRSGEGRAGIMFWLVDFGAKGQYANAATHRVTMTLNPVDQGGQPIKLGDTGFVKPA